LPELVTFTPADYEALARRIARSPSELAATRERLVAHRHTHPLFDTARFTRDVESSLFGAWHAFEQSCSGTPDTHC
jgi:predicted O-linked N-acetylglucosamine transferase (SPINDLY family)